MASRFAPRPPLLVDLFIGYIVRLRQNEIGRFLGNASDSAPENVRLHAGGVGRFMPKQ